ncbi:MAG: RecQ family ATP-dependent DNA helicase [Fimbriimonadaceae bacterium]|nr:RecQ family ATP-dependent DNA helicase [Fimbriimonadaceae bacterium]
MEYSAHRALELLRLGSGIPDAVFREGQEQAIQQVIGGSHRWLVVQRTGWGKSFVYFIAAKLLREAGAGPALLVSPLLSLMRNQIRAAERMGVRAATINSDNETAWPDVEQQLAAGQVDVLLIAPERLANGRFREQVLARIAAQVALLVIDEAHCISDWGHDFRPHYRLIERIVGTLPPNLRLLATTATANQRVMDDLQQVLGPGLRVLRGDLARPSLCLQTIALPSRAARLAWIAEQLQTLPGHGIIYVLTVRDAQQVAGWLQSRGFNVRAYTGRTGEDRPELEQALLDNQVHALVATTALGMGFDKPDLAFVMHYQAPGSVVSYYQQVGRAGRALDSAYGVLLHGEGDRAITDWFIGSAFPSPEEVAAVLGALEEAPAGLTIPELLPRVNLSKQRIEKTVELLSLESPAPIVKVGAAWQLTASRLSPAFWARIERLTDLRRREQQQMQDYLALPFGEHMRFLIAALDGDPSGITAPRLPALPSSVCPGLVRQADDFLHRTALPIQPRLRWPDGGLPSGLRGAIAEDRRAAEGRALCVWRDAGWGELVRRGKYQDGRFAEELAQACAEMVRAWNPQPAPTWVTAVPSLRHPMLVPELAQRVADLLGLRYLAALQKADGRPEQKTMQNSAQQARNVDGSLVATAAPLPRGPVLLVDDLVDSRWTMTVAAALLRQHGSGPVWPVALANTGNDE